VRQPAVTPPIRCVMEPQIRIRDIDVDRAEEVAAPTPVRAVEVAAPGSGLGVPAAAEGPDVARDLGARAGRFRSYGIIVP